MLLVDTNILIYAVDEGGPHNVPCREWLERRVAHPDPWHTSWRNLYEFLRVTTHRRAMWQPWTARGAWGFVRALLESPGFSVLNATSRHGDVTDAVIRDLPELNGNIFHDVHTAVLMREHGIRTIVTHDTDFHRFPFLEVVDPVAAG